MTDLHLTRTGPPHPRGLVILLHGGTEHDRTPLDARSRQWLRSWLMLAQIGPGLWLRGHAVWLPRYRVAGWNAGPGRVPDPVRDVRDVLARAERDLPGVPIALVGHSMGGRTAVAVADHPGVVGVVALAPWFPLGEPVTGLTGKRLYAAHGRRDEITAYADTAAYVERARRVATEATLTDMGGVGHYLLKGLRAWNRFASRSARALINAEANVSADG